MAATPRIQSLASHLEQVPAGPLTGISSNAAERLLIDCWDDLAGGYGGGMQAYKLSGRLENLVWQPPHLTFTIERHGATVMGSTRAALQEWTVDVAAGTAEYEQRRHRQLIPMDKRLNVAPIAEEIAACIVEGSEHASVSHRPNGEVVVKVGDLIHANNNQTLTARRRRFRAALEDILAEHGWEQVEGRRLYTYAHKS